MTDALRMAVPLTLLLLLTLCLTTATAVPVRTPVCDQKRFSQLGLDVANFAFCDKSLPLAKRAKSLVASMNLTEKAAQLGNKAAGVQRLGIPPYNWWSEALHGVSNFSVGTNFTNAVPGATSFPAPITTGAAFNESLWKIIGQVISTEARAMYNLGSAGLTFWSPNVDVVRDPRWGRTLEVPGECPYLVGRYAVNHVRGLQDVQGQEITEDLNSRPLKVSACCKHFAAYNVDHWFGTGNALYDRKSFSANVTEQDMVETYLRPFEMCVKEGDVSSVMCSFNEVNGIPPCANARLLRGTIRGEWDLHGYIVSDCDAVDAMADDQNFIDGSGIGAASRTLRSGLDINCGHIFTRHLERAVGVGIVKESDVDQALINNYMVLLRLGYFDSNPSFDSLGASDVCTKKNIELATDAARQGIVLLKNKALPLNSKNFSKIAVVGPHANSTHAMLANYEGVPCGYVSPIDGFASYAKVDYQAGCGEVICRNESLIWPAVKAAEAADATIILVGLDRTVEDESLDRNDLELPGYQNLFIQQVANVSKGPVVLVILSAGGVNISSHQESDDIDAILWAGYPGQQGGQAIADVVFGKYNPGGRLPLTWYPSDYVWNLPMISMHLRPIDELGYPGRTYKFFNGSTIYPFGYGLSYTNFTYTVASSQKLVEKRLAFNQHCLMLHYNQSAYIPPCQAALVDKLNCNDEDVTIDINVSNTGSIDGSDVVLLYSRAPEGIIGAPIKQLVAFQRVFVAAGKTETVTFRLSSCKSLSIVTDSAYVALPDGEHRFIVGQGSNSIEFPFHVYLKN